MAAGRLRAEFDVPVDGAAAVFTNELDDLSSVRYSVEREGNSAAISVGFVELATWVYPTIAALLGLVLAAFLVPDASLPAFLTDLAPVWGFERWWAVVFTAVVLVLCYLLSQVTTIIPGGEIIITPDGDSASNVEVRDVSEPYMYRALRNIVNKHDRHQAAARAQAQANQLTLGSVFGMGALGIGGLGRTSAGDPEAASGSVDESALDGGQSDPGGDPEGVAQTASDAIATTEPGHDSQPSVASAPIVEDPSTEVVSGEQPPPPDDR